MEKIKILHTADIHLDRRFRGFGGGKGTARRLEIRDKFVSVMNTAREEKVNVVLIAGDLFDSNHPSLSSIELVKAQFEILKADNIEVFITPGTHDCLENGSVWSREKFCENVHIFKSPFFTREDLADCNLSVYGAANESPNSSRRILRNAALDKDQAYGRSILMVHGSVAVPWAKQDNYFPISLEEINASGVDYVALGHYHSYYPFDTAVKAAYPGSPVLLDSGDTKDKCALIVEMEGGKVSLRAVKTEQNFMMDSLELDVSLINSEEEIVERLREKANPKAILSVTLKGVSALGTDFKKIIDRVRECVLAENMFFHLLWEDRTMVPFELKVDEKTARGLFIKKMEQKIKDAQEEKKRVYELALQIGVKAIDEGRI